MREHLYRGKTTKKPSGIEFDEVWVYGDLVHSGKKTYIHPQANSFQVDRELSNLVIMHEVIPETISPITKINNTKFGVGDIIEVNVSFDNPNERGIIKFGEFDDRNPDEAYTGFYVEWRGRCSEFWRKSIRWWTINHSLKVIGNIFDNPELLK